MENDLGFNQFVEDCTWRFNKQFNDVKEDIYGCQEEQYKQKVAMWASKFVLSEQGVLFEADPPRGFVWKLQPSNAEVLELQQDNEKGKMAGKDIFVDIEQNLALQHTITKAEDGLRTAQEHHRAAEDALQLAEALLQDQEAGRPDDQKTQSIRSGLENVRFTIVKAASLGDNAMEATRYAKLFLEYAQQANDAVRQKVIKNQVHEAVRAADSAFDTASRYEDFPQEDPEPPRVFEVHQQVKLAVASAKEAVEVAACPPPDFVDHALYAEEAERAIDKAASARLALIRGIEKRIADMKSIAENVCHFVKTTRQKNDDAYALAVAAENAANNLDPGSDHTECKRVRELAEDAVSATNLAFDDVEEAEIKVKGCQEIFDRASDISGVLRDFKDEFASRDVVQEVLQLQGLLDFLPNDLQIAGSALAKAEAAHNKAVETIHLKQNILRAEVHAIRMMPGELNQRSEHAQISLTVATTKARSAVTTVSRTRQSADETYHPPEYKDSMQKKIVSAAKARQAAISQMQQALREARTVAGDVTDQLARVYRIQNDAKEWLRVCRQDVIRPELTVAEYLAVEADSACEVLEKSKSMLEKSIEYAKKPLHEIHAAIVAPDSPQMCDFCEQKAAADNKDYGAQGNVVIRNDGVRDHCGIAYHWGCLWNLYRTVRKCPSCSQRDVKGFTGKGLFADIFWQVFAGGNTDGAVVVLDKIIELQTSEGSDVKSYRFVEEFLCDVDVHMIKSVRPKIDLFKRNGNKQNQCTQKKTDFQSENVHTKMLRIKFYHAIQSAYGSLYSPQKAHIDPQVPACRVSIEKLHSSQCITFKTHSENFSEPIFCETFGAILHDILSPCENLSMKALMSFAMDEFYTISADLECNIQHEQDCDHPGKSRTIKRLLQRLSVTSEMIKADSSEMIKACHSSDELEMIDTTGQHQSESSFPDPAFAPPLSQQEQDQHPDQGKEERKGICSDDENSKCRGQNPQSEEQRVSSDHEESKVGEKAIKRSIVVEEQSELKQRRQPFKFQLIVDSKMIQRDDDSSDNSSGPDLAGSCLRGPLNLDSDQAVSRDGTTSFLQTSAPTDPDPIATFQSIQLSPATTSRVLSKTSALASAATAISPRRPPQQVDAVCAQQTLSSIFTSRQTQVINALETVTYFGLHFVPHEIFVETCYVLQMNA